MVTKSILILIWIALAGGTIPAWAEMRLWTDKKGNTLEAEFVNIVAGRVILRTPDDRQIKVVQTGLCDEDREYLKNAIPPVIEIDADVDLDTSLLDSGSEYINKRQAVKCKFTIAKKNRDTSTQTFTAHLYVFAMDLQRKQLFVVAKSEHAFTFEKEAKFSLASAPLSLTFEKHERAERDTGEEYAAYLIFIQDSQGRVVCAKSNRSAFEKNVDRVKKAEHGSYFTTDLHLLKRNRNTD